MTKGKVFLIVLVSTAIFLLVYTPHFAYPFPSHIDEWHHITEAIKLQEGEYSGGTMGYRVGFHLLLLLLSKITNPVLIYQFLPAIWAVFSALALFYVVYKKTNKQFYIALLAVIFFASIKSNVNITGLWFFTPLTFSLPFIFLYVYFFTEGIEKQNKKFILASLAIIVVLLFIHSISVLFAIPFLLIYSLFNFRYIKKEWKFFSLFLIIPVIGILFYKFVTKTPWNFLIRNLIKALQFERGWGVLEIDNSFFELYSLIGYILAIIGLILVFRNEKNLKKYLAYGLWPITVLILIMIYKKTGVSYLSPYQRNLYYFVIGLPILSALGLNYLFKLTKKKTLVVIVFIVVIFFTFKSYWEIPEQLDLYQVIDSNDYQAFLFLSALPKSVVMADPMVSVAMYPISQQEPVATLFFYGNREDAKMFFSLDDCKAKQQILNEYKVRYVLSKFKIDCGWDLIYDKENYIYEVR
ncbi:hypothetical protein KJA13_03220 [Patescibacteria group bacterium]|nr:hypothetical protein [Patescibacteria group bacterium]